MIPTRNVARLVRRLAWRLAPPGPTRRQELPDCEQDLWAHLLEAWPQYDPLRGAEGAFAHAVLLRACRSIVRARYARKRRPVAAEEWQPQIVERAKLHENFNAFRSDLEKAGPGPHFRQALETGAGAPPSLLRIALPVTSHSFWCRGFGCLPEQRQHR